LAPLFWTRAGRAAGLGQERKGEEAEACYVPVWVQEGTGTVSWARQSPNLGHACPAAGFLFGGILVLGCGRSK
jgi:hypothetical protein